MNLIRRLFGLPLLPRRVKREPVEDAVFGRLEWQSQYGYWKGEVKFDEVGAFDLNVEPSSDREPLPGDVQRDSFRRFRPRIKEIREAAFAQFLPDFNEHWNQEDEPFTAARLSAALFPYSLNVQPDGSIQVSWTDDIDDMIIGANSLRVSVAPDGRFEVDIEG